MVVSQAVQGRACGSAQLPRPGTAAEHCSAACLPAALDRKLQLLIEIRDGMEIVHSADYILFLQSFLKVFAHLLETTQPQTSDTLEHRVRNLVLEIVNRLPANDMLKPFAGQLMGLLLNVLQRDNEDNAVVCLRILFDLHKAYKGTLEDYVQPFMEFVRRVRNAALLAANHHRQSSWLPWLFSMQQAPMQHCLHNS